MFPNARNEKPTTNFNQDIFFLSQKGADESIVRGDASSSEPLNQLATWLSGDRGKLLVRCRLGNPGRYTEGIFFEVCWANLSSCPCRVKNCHSPDLYFLLFQRSKKVGLLLSLLNCARARTSRVHCTVLRVHLQSSPRPHPGPWCAG